MNDKKLQKLLKEWQKILRLQDWRIVAKLTAPEEMETEGAYGRIRWDLGLKQATIQVADMDAADDADANPMNQDMEETLVHELLHLHFDMAGSPKKNGWRKGLKEAAIEATALALVELKRGRREKV